MEKTRTHTVMVNITFNKPVSRQAAIAAAKNGIHGDLYADIFEEERYGWERAKIGKIKAAPAK